jgi:hypothetical protein
MASLYRLTVYEHLWFFARLKNQPEDGLSEQIEQMILDLGIPHKRYPYQLHLYSVDVRLLFNFRVFENLISLLLKKCCNSENSSVNDIQAQGRASNHPAISFFFFCSLLFWPSWIRILNIYDTSTVL